MPRITMYVVQSFVTTKGGGLDPGEPFECISAGDARVEAQLIAEKGAGVIAWSKSGDPETGVWEDAVILFQAGRIGDWESTETRL